MTIRTATVDRVATIEIARPERKNALTFEMYAQMADALRAAAADAQVRAVLITGQPGIFCSGNDLEDFVARPPADTLVDTPVHRFMTALVECDKPVVAAVTGAAIGIGTTMLLHCDLVYASDEARFAMPFTSLGLVPEFGSSLLVPQLVGRRRAAPLLLLGDPFTAQDALDAGIVNGVLPPAEVVPHARRMAERFVQLPPGAVQGAKKLIGAPGRAGLMAAIEEESRLFSQRLRSPEAQEAFQAFFQKRKPDFSPF